MPIAGTEEHNFMNFKTLVIATITIILASSPAFSQERTITEKEFEDVDSVATEFLKKVSYRSIGRDDTSETIYESVPPDRTRLLVTKKTNGITTRTETIKIGPKTFVRKDGGTWVIPEPQGPRYAVRGDPVDAERTSEYKLTSGVMFGDEKTGIYQNTEITTSKSIGFRRVWTQRLWINEKGMMVKYESIYTDAGGTGSYTLVYEYDPKIKIVAPIKTTAKKKN